MSMITTPTSADVTATLARIAAQREEWTAKRAHLAAQLARAEAGAATAALGGTGTTKLATDLSRAREEIRITDGALALLATQHEAATYALRLAEQNDRRARYVALQAEEAALWTRVEELWQPLGALTGATAEILRDRLPALNGITRRLNMVRSEINFREDFLRDEEREGYL